MIRLVSILLLSLLALSVLGQSGNPFEIRQQDSVQTEDILEEDEEITPAIKVNSDNPFEITYSGKPSTAAVDETKVEVKAQVAVSSSRGTKGPSRGLVLIYSIVALILLSVSIAFNRGRFNTIMGSLINGNNLKNLHRGNKPWTDVQSLLLYGLFFTNSAFFLWLVGARLFDGGVPGYLYILIGLILTYMVRHLAMIILSEIYILGNVTEQFNYSVALHNMAIGVVVIPFILSLGYVADQSVVFVSVSMFVVVAVVYLLRQSKGFLSAIGIRGFNPFYFFIYLCAFEIIPILIAWKVVDGAL